MTETIAEKAASELLDTAKRVAEQLLLHADGKGVVVAPASMEMMSEEISKAIGQSVNGKINNVHDLLEEQNIVIEAHHQERIHQIEEVRKEICDHNKKHEKDMERILPVVEAFEEGQRDLASAKKGGKLVLWLAATVTAIGGAILIIRALFWGN